jgi:hypothetical protein
MYIEVKDLHKSAVFNLPASPYCLVQERNFVSACKWIEFVCPDVNVDLLNRETLVKVLQTLCLEFMTYMYYYKMRTNLKTSDLMSDLLYDNTLDMGTWAFWSWLMSDMNLFELKMDKYYNSGEVCVMWYNDSYPALFEPYTVMMHAEAFTGSPIVNEMTWRVPEGGVGVAGVVMEKVVRPLFDKIITTIMMKDPDFLVPRMIGDLQIVHDTYYSWCGPTRYSRKIASTNVSEVSPLHMVVDFKGQRPYITSKMNLRFNGVGKEVFTVVTDYSSKETPFNVLDIAGFYPKIFTKDDLNYPGLGLFKLYLDMKEFILLQQKVIMLEQRIEKVEL